MDFNNKKAIIFTLILIFLTVSFLFLHNEKGGDLNEKQVEDRHSYAPPHEIFKEKESKQSAKEKSKTQNVYQDPLGDSDKDGVLNWEEKIREINPLKEYSNKEYSTPTAPDFENKDFNSIYQELFPEIKENAENKSDNKKEDVSNKQPTEVENLKKYGNDIISAIEKNKPNSVWELEVFKNIIENPENEVYLEDLREISSDYESVANELKKVDFPKEASELNLHTKLSNAYLELSKNIKALINESKEESVFSENAQNYNKSAVKIIEVLGSGAEFFKEKDIEFLPFESGYLFTQMR